MSNSEVNRPDRNGPDLRGDERRPDAFELRLHEALRHSEPPEGFAERVFAKRGGPAAVVSAAAVAQQDVLSSAQAPVRLRLLARPRLRIWAAGALAAVLLSGAFLAEEQHLERLKAEAAQRQFDAGMRVTDRALEHVRVQLEEAGVRVSY